MTNIRRTPLGIGEAAPWFRGTKIDGTAGYPFHAMGGRHLLMLFFGSSGHPEAGAALAKVAAHAELFDDEKAAFFGVSVDPADSGRVHERIPGIRIFLDQDRTISRLYGAELEGHEGKYHAHWLILDRLMRVAGQFPLGEGDKAFEALTRMIAESPEQEWAPVLTVTNVFEAGLCRHLIALHEKEGGEETGYMREVEGETRLVTDRAQKIRRDIELKDAELIRQINLRLRMRLFPMVERCFMFRPTRVERARIGCYEGDDGGHFRGHRDNTTKGTAHRRFAVSVNLNAEDYEGGDLVFPEFGPRAYRAPTGGAIVFSCSLLHEVMPVTRGRRYAYLPFLFDEAAAKIYEANRRAPEDSGTGA